MGIQPGMVAPGAELSAEVAASLPLLVEAALGVLDGWASGMGHQPREERAV